MDHENRMRSDAAFARWYTQHHDRIRSLCARILRDPAAGEDLAQETLLRAWTHRESIRDKDVGAWLSVVARNLCVSYLRRESRVVPIETAHDHPDHSADPAREAERSETRHNVRRALGGVSRKHRRVLYLREVDGVDYKELGSELGMTPEGVRSIAFRARAALRDHLAAVGEGFSAVAFGLKVRIRAVRARLNAQSQMIEASLSSAINVGLGLAVVVGTAASFGFSSSPAAIGLSGSAARRQSVSAAVPRHNAAVSRGESVSASEGAGTVLGPTHKPKVGAGFRAEEDPKVDVILVVPNPVNGEDMDLGGVLVWDDQGPVSSRVIPVYRDICARTPVCEILDRRL